MDQRRMTEQRFVAAVEFSPTVQIAADGCTTAAQWRSGQNEPASQAGIGTLARCWCRHRAAAQQPGGQKHQFCSA
eukprot:2703645-Rhodomonas_salina.1